MALKTPQQYLESLKDGRVVYCDGREGPGRDEAPDPQDHERLGRHGLRDEQRPQVSGPSHGHRRGWREGELRAPAAAEQRGPPAAARGGEAVGPRLLRQAHRREVRRKGRPERGHCREPQGGQEVRHPLCGKRRGLPQAPPEERPRLCHGPHGRQGRQEPPSLPADAAQGLLRAHRGGKGRRHRRLRRKDPHQPGPCVQRDTDRPLPGHAGG